MYNSEGSKFGLIEWMLVVAVLGLALTFIYPMVQNGETKKVTATIVGIYHEDPEEWGCVGTNVKTSVKTEEGFVDQICGSYGGIGEQITGYWTEGAADNMKNGFKTVK